MSGGDSYRARGILSQEGSRRRREQRGKRGGIRYKEDTGEVLRRLVISDGSMICDNVAYKCDLVTYLRRVISYIGLVIQGVNIGVLIPCPTRRYAGKEARRKILAKLIMRGLLSQ